jgi:hypothetical protein
MSQVAGRDQACQNKNTRVLPAHLYQILVRKAQKMKLRLKEGMVDISLETHGVV